MTTEDRHIAEAYAVLHPNSAALTAALYEAALREMEQHRDELTLACATLRRLLENERKIAARERGAPEAADAGRQDPDVASGAPVVERAQDTKG